MSAIQVGDLVMVVRGTPCCRRPYRLGLVFKVEELRTLELVEGCPYCHKTGFREDSAFCKNPRVLGLPLSMLRKIDPLSEPETVETEATA